MNPLERRVLPGLNEEVSALGAGCWTIGGPASNNGVPIGWDGVDENDAYAGLLRAHELGVTLFDTADVYGMGRSERLLGRLLGTVNRSSVVVSSKVGYFAGTGPHPYHPAQIRHQFATTLRNLDTDHLDVYFLHSSDFGEGDRYLPGAVEVMHKLRQEGLVRAIGMRAPHTFAEEWAAGDGPGVAQAARFLYLFDAIRPDVVTARYNLLSPLYAGGETDIFAFARRYGTGVLIKQALGQGLLLGSHHPDTPPTFSDGDHRTTDPQFRPEALRMLRDLMDPIRARFGDSPADLARVALRYALQHVPDAAVLVGFRNADQIHTTLTCLGNPLCLEEIAWIRAAFHAQPNTSTEREGHLTLKYIEVEKKFALADPDALKAKLDELGAKPSEPTRQVDAYYNAPHRDFLAPEAISEWLRLRTEERGPSINFKRWHPVDALIKTHADEYESKIDDVEAVRRLLEALDFTPLVTVDKVREEWKLPAVEVVFDHVEGAGTFVEFEFKGDAENVEEATARLDEFVASLDVTLGKLVSRGYPHILLGREH